jgi:methylated-DNA-[protein]-cysteine S-methyltransferase
MNTTYYGFMDSPIGDLLLIGNGTALTHLYMQKHKYGFLPQPQWRRDDAVFTEARRQLDAYFGGELQAFDLPLAMSGTDFQLKVWQALCTIPFGRSESYGELARRIGAPHASRAVGLANGRNPISIIVPCHRVIGADGSLTGYGGGLERKRWLLAHEASRGYPQVATGPQLQSRLF